MTFEFAHDGQSYLLRTTENGEVQCDPIDAAPPPPLEPSGDCDE